mgnify:CR=1 FL=1
MAVLFTANSLRVVEEDGDALIVAFGALDTNGEPITHVLLSRNLDPKEDWAGINGVYVQRDSDANSVWGGISSFELHVDRVRIRSNPATATAVFDGSDDVTIGLDVDPDELDDAHEALERLFHNCNCYIPHTL